MGQRFIKLSSVPADLRAAGPDCRSLNVEGASHAWHPSRDAPLLTDGLAWPGLALLSDSLREGWALDHTGGLLSPGSWCPQIFFVCAFQEPVSPVLCKFCNRIPLASEVKFPGGSQSLWPDPQVGKSAVGPRTFSAAREFIWYNGSEHRHLCGLTSYGGTSPPRGWGGGGRLSEEQT